MALQPQSSCSRTLACLRSRYAHLTGPLSCNKMFITCHMGPSIIRLVQKEYDAAELQQILGLSQEQMCALFGFARCSAEVDQRPEKPWRIAASKHCSCEGQSKRLFDEPFVPQLSCRRVHTVWMH